MDRGHYDREAHEKREERFPPKQADPPERKEVFLTSAGMEVARLYEPSRDDGCYAEAVGAPGDYPYTRGIYPAMYRGKLWTMRQYSGFGSARETNERFHFLLEKGQTGLSCAFDLPTQMGYDSDASLAVGEVGKVGVAIDTLQDMEELFRNIPLGQVSTSMTINAPAAILLAMYISVAEKRGIPLPALTGTVQNDVLKEYIARGTYIFPPRESLRLTTDVIAFCMAHMPKFKPISVSGYHMREAGANAVQELAFTLANGITYMQAAEQVGLDVDQVAPRFSFFLSVHNHLFEEIAKFRAARRVWAKIAREQFGARNPKSWQFRVHAQTAGSTLTAAQPDNNVARVTLQALAGVLGGMQSLHTNAKDEALSLPTEETAQGALATQQIIAYESGVADTVDPLAGSYFVENLTDHLEQGVWEYLDKIEQLGGALAAVERGYLQTEIQREAYRTQRRVEKGEDIVVGVNQLKEATPHKIALHRTDGEAERRQQMRLKKLRRNRDKAAVKNALKQIKTVAAEEGQNIMPAMISAVKCYTTVGEICDALRDVYGEYDPQIPTF